MKIQNIPHPIHAEAKAQLLKLVGRRVKLIQFNPPDPYTSLRSGDQGTIQGVDDIGQLQVKWDCGSNLSLHYAQDQYELLSDAELSQKDSPTAAL